MPDPFPQARTRLLMIAVMLVMGIMNIVCAERLTANGGLGWDGATYASLVRDFHQRVFVDRIDEYRVGRILPCAVVHYGMRLFGVETTNRNVIFAFDIYNLLLLLLCADVWARMARELKLSAAGAWFGFWSLFLSYATLKHNVYHSVLTDTTGFALGLLMFYFYLAEKPLGLIAVMVTGAFTWPTVSHLTALLYVFPRTIQPDPGPLPPPKRLHVWCAAAAAAAVCAGILVLTGPLHEKLMATFPRILRVNMTLLPLSVLATTVYVFFAVRGALNEGRLFNVRAVLSELRWKRAVVAGLLLVALKMTTHLMANDVGPWATMKMFAAYILALSVSDPLLFYVAHAAYFGPIMILLALTWRHFCDNLSRFGIGLRLFVILNVALSLNSQSRQMINSVGVFVPLTVMLLDRRKLRVADLGLWVVLCLIYSKIWYVMNRGSQDWDGTIEDLLSFPLQHYYMTSGPWMSHQTYLIHAAVVLVTAVLLYFVLARRGPEAGVAEI